MLPILLVIKNTKPKEIADSKAYINPIKSISTPIRLIKTTPVKEIIIKNHCIIFIFSFKKNIANTVAKIGEVYLIETEIPRSKYLILWKKRTIEIRPKKALNRSINLLFPKIFILVNKINGVVKDNDIKALKKMIW